MATICPRGDLVGWIINMKHFRSGKTVGISSLDEKANRLMPAEGFKPMTSR